MKKFFLSFLFLGHLSLFCATQQGPYESASVKYGYKVLRWLEKQEKAVQTIKDRDLKKKKHDNIIKMGVSALNKYKKKLQKDMSKLQQYQKSNENEIIKKDIAKKIKDIQNGLIHIDTIKIRVERKKRGNKTIDSLIKKKENIFHSLYTRKNKISDAASQTLYNVSEKIGSTAKKAFSKPPVKRHSESADIKLQIIKNALKNTEQTTDINKIQAEWEIIKASVYTLFVEPLKRDITQFIKKSNDTFVLNKKFYDLDNILQETPSENNDLKQDIIAYIAHELMPSKYWHEFDPMTVTFERVVTIAYQAPLKEQEEKRQEAYRKKMKEKIARQKREKERQEKAKKELAKKTIKQKKPKNIKPLTGISLKKSKPKQINVPVKQEPQQEETSWLKRSYRALKSIF